MLYGCLPPKIDIRDYKICSSVKAEDYPRRFQLSNLPKVKDQSNINSCCAHATSSILEYFDRNTHELSTDFIYGIQKSECGHQEQGMYLKDALKIVLKYGDPLEKDCRGNHEVPECWDVAEKTLSDNAAMSDAYQYRIQSYYLCNTTQDIKYALTHYGPVLAGVYWYEEYSWDMGGVVYFNPKSECGGHAVFIVGWNETGWVMQNSWGTGFGDKGRFTLPYEYELMEARALIDYDNGQDIALKGKKLNPLTNTLCKVVNRILNFAKNLLGTN